MVTIQYHACRIVITEASIMVIHERVGSHVLGVFALSVDGMEEAIAVAKSVSGAAPMPSEPFPEYGL